MKYAPALILLALASCNVRSELFRSPAGTTYDGTYGGLFDLMVESSPETCPRSFGQPAIMVVRDGAARVDLPQASYFNGNVGADGRLTMISGGGRTAFVNGRIADGVFTGEGAGPCQYRINMTKQPVADGSTVAGRPLPR